MSDDWKPGDLALCVCTDRRVSPDGLWTQTGGRFLRRGAPYCVEAVMLNPRTRMLNLVLREVRSDSGTGGFAAWRFRKIHPHTPDAEDAETIQLMGGKPVKQPA